MLTVTGLASAGNTIVGAGQTGTDRCQRTASGTFSNLTIAGRVRLAGPLGVTGNLTLTTGAELNLNGQAASVTQALVTNVAAGVLPAIVGPNGTLGVNSVNVNGLVLDHVPFTIGGGALTRFDNVAFTHYAAADTQLVIQNPGAAAIVQFNGLSFLTIPTSGRYIHAADTAADAQVLTIDVVNAVPADGSAFTTTAGGAAVNWITTAGTANLSVTQSAAPTPAVSGSPLTFTAVVHNGGPVSATGVTFTWSQPGGAAITSAVPSQGTCSITVGIGCALGTLAVNGTAQVTIVVTPGAAAAVTGVATAGLNQADPIAANNTSTLTVPVVAAGALADLSIVKDDSADPVVAGTPFTYTLSVTNAGPAPATDVFVTDTIPAGLVVSTASSPLGACSITGSQVQCPLGTLAAGQTIVVTINVSATVAGLVTNVATVSSSAPDTNTTNNLAVEQTMIAVAAACGASLAGPALLPVGAAPALDLLTADLNRDGNPDLVTTLPAANSVAVFLGNGDGLFSGPNLFPAGTGALEGVLVDFNGDQNLDLALEGLNSAFVLFGNAAGGFGAPVPFSFAPDVVSDVRASDFNNDGSQDLLITTVSGTDSSIRILLGNGAGSFAAPTVASVLGQGATRVVIGDFNRDGRADIAVSYSAAGGATFSDVVTILLGDGQGGFASPTNIPIPQTVSTSFLSPLGDLNGDGFTDLGLVEFAGTTRRLVLLFGDGNGGFTPQLLANAPPSIFRLASGDINGDGSLDLVLSDLNQIAVQLGNGAGGFAAPVFYAVPIPDQVLTADLNLDGRMDIAAASRAGTGFVAILLNRCGQPETDLSLVVTDAPDPAVEGDLVTYSVTVSNNGSTASGVSLTTVKGGTGSIESATPQGGACTINGTLVSCSLGTLQAGATSNVVIAVRQNAGGVLTSTFTVTSDQADANPSDNTRTATTTITAAGRTILVTTTSDSGPGSLRQAITESNSDAGDIDRIHFAIPGGGVHSITPLTSLPQISQPAIIDGRTQPGFVNTPLIELNGNGLAANGLTITGGNTTVSGLAINRFGGAGISINTAGGNTIAGNFIGTDTSGTAARPNAGAGVQVNTSNNVIGGTTPAARNIISGNQGTAVSILGAASTGNVVQGNYLGTDVTGTLAIPNLSIQSGVFIQGGSNNLVGGTAAGAGNVVSGNANHAITVVGSTASGNIIQGNLVGTDPTGQVRVANTGIAIDIVSAVNTIIGGPGAARNVISGNGTGIQIRTGATGNVVQGNLIGTNVNGTGSISNGLGISLNDNVTGNTIGGTAAGAGNVISGNTGTAISLTINANGNTIAGNRIGTNAAGTVVLANTSSGIALSNSTSNTIGGSVAGAGNVISGNGSGGINVGAGANGTVIEGNLIGTDVTGAVALGNGNSNGITVVSANNRIGGTTAAQRNVISGNNSPTVVNNGVSISGVTATGNFITGNYIGVNAAGTAALPNRGSGVLVQNQASNTVIGGTTAGSGNLISGNGSNGVSVSPGATFTAIHGNLIGVNQAGTGALGNGANGITIQTNSTTVGSIELGARNIISGNTLNGVVIAAAEGANAQASLNVVLGNYIGTNAAGTAAVPNGQSGISFQVIGAGTSVTSNEIGRSTSGAGNVISGNTAHGISIVGTGSSGNIVQGNFIGTNATGDAARVQSVPRRLHLQRARQPDRGYGGRSRQPDFRQRHQRRRHLRNRRDRQPGPGQPDRHECGGHGGDSKRPGGRWHRACLEQLRGKRGRRRAQHHCRQQPHRRGHVRNGERKLRAEQPDWHDAGSPRPRQRQRRGDHRLRINEQHDWRDGAERRQHHRLQHGTWCQPLCAHR